MKALKIIAASLGVLILVIAGFVFVIGWFFSDGKDEYLTENPIKRQTLANTEIVLVYSGDQGAMGFNGYAVLQRKLSPKSADDYRVLCNTQNKEELDFELSSGKEVKCVLSATEKVVQLPWNP